MGKTQLVGPWAARTSRLGGPLLLGMCVALPARAAAEVDARGPTVGLEGLVQAADFDAAEKEAERLLDSGALTRRQVASVHLELGIVASARRDPAKAGLEFRRALRLEGGLRLPSWVGPQVGEVFDRAATPLPPDDPKVVLAPVAGSAQVSVDATAGRNDDSLARRLLVRLGGVSETRDLGEAPLRFVVALPVSVARCATVTASVLDEHDNELWPGIASAEICRPSTSQLPPVTGPGGDPAVLRATTAARSRPVSRPVLILGAATGAAAIATGVLGWVALERRSEYNDSFDGSTTVNEQKKLHDLAATAELRATVGAVVTGLLAAATTVLYIRGRF